MWFVIVGYYMFCYGSGSVMSSGLGLFAPGFAACYRSRPGPASAKQRRAARSPLA